ncbi:hypothetical protein [Streptomyces sp. NPDC005805]|uniref:hypothetical protein n=1 Tax=Streptomyces sp. NPDC005805 TaxID=3157068 RepID=UPI0033D7672D
MPPAAPAAPEPTVPPEAPAPAPVVKDRRVLRAVLRWTAAVAVFATVAAGSAYAVVDRERTDVPGLATLDDGRWTYPKLSRPALPAGAPLPFAPSNHGEIHYADLEKLLLPAPAGAAADPSLRGERSRVGVERYLKEYVADDRELLREHLRESRVREVVARGWRMPDGTTTRIFLLRFHTSAVAGDYFDTELGGGPDTLLQPVGVEEMSSYDEDYDKSADVTSTERYVYDEPAPRGPVHVRHAYITAGDTIALVVLSRKGEVPAVPFHQTVVLQNQLLG